LRAWRPLRAPRLTPAAPHARRALRASRPPRAPLLTPAASAPRLTHSANLLPAPANLLSAPRQPATCSPRTSPSCERALPRPVRSPRLTRWVGALWTALLWNVVFVDCVGGDGAAVGGKLWMVRRFDGGI